MWKQQILVRKMYIIWQYENAIINSRNKRCSNHFQWRPLPCHHFLSSFHMNQKSYILVRDSSQIEPVQDKIKYNFHTELFTVTRVVLIIRLKFSTICHIIQYFVLLIMSSFWIHLIFFLSIVQKYSSCGPLLNYCIIIYTS